MAASDGQPGAASLAFSSVGAVDAHVAADGLRRVVLVAEHPVDLLGQPRRDRGRERAARLQHADELGDRRGVGRDVLEHLAGDDAVEASPSANGRRVASPCRPPTKRSSVDLAGFGHRRERGPCAGDLAAA